MKNTARQPMENTTRLYLLDLVRQAQQATAAHAAAVRAAARAAKAADQARARVDEVARQRPTAQDPEQTSEFTDELGEALEDYADYLNRLQAAKRDARLRGLAPHAPAPTPPRR